MIDWLSVFPRTFARRAIAMARAGGDVASIRIGRRYVHGLPLLRAELLSGAGEALLSGPWQRWREHGVFDFPAEYVETVMATCPSLRIELPPGVHRRLLDDGERRWLVAHYGHRGRRLLRGLLVVYVVAALVIAASNVLVSLVLSSIALAHTLFLRRVEMRNPGEAEILVRDAVIITVKVAGFRWTRSVPTSRVVEWTFDEDRRSVLVAVYGDGTASQIADGRRVGDDAPAAA